MQTTEDGEYVPVKELDVKFKIPKKKDPATEDPPVPPQNQVLESSYYNQPPEPGAMFRQFAASPGPAADHVQNLVLSVLQKDIEKPKTYSNHLLKDTIPDLFDDTLPKELTGLFQPLYCKLCTAQLSSNVVAKLHYKSKNHEKKMRKFLTDHSERTGQPLHPRALATPKDANDDNNPMYFHCDVCDLPLTGKLHAESHYLGKNHRKATLGVKRPAGKGHFDVSGKWIREKRLADDNDGFGEDFRVPEKKPAPSFVCDICNVITTCKEQLDSHYSGQKHQKKVKKFSAGAGFDLSPLDGVPPPSDNILSSVLTPEGGKIADCSVYRTPSGQYYCPTCNSSMNSEIQFRQHMQSKNHLKKAAQKRP